MLTLVIVNSKLSEKLLSYSFVTVSEKDSTTGVIQLSFKTLLFKKFLL